MYHQREPATDPQSQPGLEQGCMVWRMSIKTLPGGGAEAKIKSTKRVLLVREPQEPTSRAKGGRGAKEPGELRAGWKWSQINR